MDTKLPQISASKIKTYRTCAKKYQYTYIDKPELPISEERNIAAMLGTVLHRVIEARYKDPSIDAVALFHARMFTMLEEWTAAGYSINGEQYFSKNIKEGMMVLNEYDWDALQPLELELYFSCPFPNPVNPIARVIGYIDMVTVDGRVIDHKSQRNLPAPDELANDAQMLIYYWAYSQIYGHFPKGVYWNNLRTGELIDTNAHNDYERKMSRLTDDITALLNNKYWARINLSSICRKECQFYQRCYGDSNVSIDKTITT